MFNCLSLTTKCCHNYKKVIRIALKVSSANGFRHLMSLVIDCSRKHGLRLELVALGLYEG